VTIEIVEAGADRIEELEPLWHALVQHHAVVAVGLGEPRERADAWARRRVHYEELLAKPGAFALIAERDGVPVGYAMVEPDRPSQSWQIDAAATLETLVVLPEARGAGIGTRLLEAVKERVRAAGVTHLGLGVVAANENAIRFYRRHGFEPAFVDMVTRL
jgi:ribosomal protein S18 acetylase RimI-like enzyme